MAANFTHYVYLSRTADITISATPKGLNTLIGLIDVRFLNDSYNYHSVTMQSIAECNATIIKWFTANNLILLDTEDNIKLLSDNHHRCDVVKFDGTKYLIFNAKWIIYFTYDYNIIIADYFINSGEGIEIGFITDSQFKWLLVTFNHGIEKFTYGQKFTIKPLKKELPKLLIRLGSIFIRQEENYNKLYEYVNKIQDVKDDNINNVGTTNSLPGYPSCNIITTDTLVGQVKRDTADILTENPVKASNKYCKLAFEYYLEQAKALFSVETVLLEIEQKAKEGHLSIEYSLLQRKIYKAFGENQCKPFPSELKSIIEEMYENFKRKMGKEGLSVSIKDDMLVIETQIPQSAVDELKKKYVV